MIDYAFKSKIMGTELPYLEKKVGQSLFFNSTKETKDFTMFTYQEACTISQFFLKNNIEGWLEAHRINHASYQRTSRLRKRIAEIISNARLANNNVLFLTFTFTDACLNSTNFETRRRYVSRFLRSNCVRYVANVDYGSKNGREHYHAVVLANGKLDYTKWTNGSLNGKKVAINDICHTKLAKYVSKLTNHAIKATCKRSVLIYSR